ncbi:class I SAM-dependent methyltransferase [Mesobacterium sp. TK19101]|uniref:Class I SAM-dependent methyltransferase n=1 Tax=Mesobacterium hydrothermale TaxID=3111907 RepID=A0ABU6HLE2_9RHOB|nr:class I SAM-dependent methyltransferase [Mesobacterium sp. TK19101]MEC3862917.1 class I SAM-dependent methyltransferase [Mesobacterium sp. TK19101]
MSDRETIAVYDARAAEYDQITKAEEPGTLLKAFVAALPKGARVLDLGCGPGGASRVMGARGFIVDGMDASAEMVALAGQHPGVTAWQAEFSDLDADGIYDGVWANFSLLHAPRDDMPSHLAAIKRALRPGGVFHVAVKEGDGSRRDGIGRLYTYYTETALRGLLEQAGFTPREFRSGVDMGLDGVEAPWISVLSHA